MTDKIRELVDNLISKNYIDAEDDLKEALNIRAGQVLEYKKKNLQELSRDTLVRYRNKAVDSEPKMLKKIRNAETESEYNKAYDKYQKRGDGYIMAGRKLSVRNKNGKGTVFGAKVPAAVKEESIQELSSGKLRDYQKAAVEDHARRMGLAKALSKSAEKSKDSASAEWKKKASENHRRVARNRTRGVFNANKRIYK